MIVTVVVCSKIRNFHHLLWFCCDARPEMLLVYFLKIKQRGLLLQFNNPAKPWSTIYCRRHLTFCLFKANVYHWALAGCNFKTGWLPVWPFADPGLMSEPEAAWVTLGAQDETLDPPRLCFLLPFSVYQLCQACSWLTWCDWLFKVFVLRDSVAFLEVRLCKVYDSSINCVRQMS